MNMKIVNLIIDILFVAINGKNVRVIDNLSFKTGRVVIVTSGRFAGKKAIVAKNYEDGTKV